MSQLLYRTSMCILQVNSMKTNESKIIKFIGTIFFPDK